VPIAILAIAGFLVSPHHQAAPQNASDFVSVKETAREDLVALADDLQGLEHKVDGNDAAKRDYLPALDKYRRRRRSSTALCPPASSRPSPNRWRRVGI